MEIYVKSSLISTFSLFVVFSHYFIIYIDFTRIAASKQQLMMSQIMSHLEY